METGRSDLETHRQYMRHCVILQKDIENGLDDFMENVGPTFKKASENKLDAIVAALEEKSKAL